MIGTRTEGYDARVKAEKDVSLRLDMTCMSLDGKSGNDKDDDK